MDSSGEGQMHRRVLSLIVALALVAPITLAAQGRGGRGGGTSWADSIKYKYPSTPQLDRLKADAAREIDGMAKKIQEMVDMVFSFAEPGFQGFETVKYLTGILEENGFKVERGVAGMPTAFVARWGSGKPVISLGSDIDDIPQASNKPGGAWPDPPRQGQQQARRRVARPARRGRARSRRRAQLRDAAQRRRRDHGEEAHGARPHSRHDRALARRRGRADVGQGVAPARGRRPGRRRRAL